MKVLWAPWRIEYILKREEGCFFCEKPKEDRDEENLILCRGRKAFVILNAFPYNNGHLMIATYRHVVNLEDLSDDELGELLKLARESILALKRELRPNGFNLGINLGKAAGVGLEHFHLHIVPRWRGDTNYMPVLASTKVIPEHLKATYRRLLKHFKV
jgi:ATP adenylyltransferase